MLNILVNVALLVGIDDNTPVVPPDKVIIIP